MPINNVDRLKVFLDIESNSYLVGTLIEQKGKIYFEYDQDFSHTNLEISPFYLPLKTSFFDESWPKEFFGLPGVFYDSLPDGWGLLLMDRKFSELGININEISPLTRLAFLHNRSIGAFRYEPELVLLDHEEKQFLDLAYLSEAAEKILNGSTQQVVSDLLITGGSPQGARPKALIGLNKLTQQAVYGCSDLPEGYEHYIIKFCAKGDQQSFGVVEYIYSLMARNAGINMPDTQLIELNNGQRLFAIKRFDRIENKKLHTHTLAGLIHSDFRVPEVGYEHLLRVTMGLTHDQQAVKYAFRQMLFNIMTYNRDDHAKNFSFLMDAQGKWSLSPAYDLVFSSGINGWHTLSIGTGKQINPEINEVYDLANSFNINNKTVDIMLSEIKDAIDQWPKLATQFEVENNLATKIEKQFKIVDIYS